ncbi:hypothetical protein DENSPDRAFT_752427, partial [Dentipellis sp. KUC8613]
LRKRGVPVEYARWAHHKLKGRKTCLTFDGSDPFLFELPCGTDQGCPSSGIWFQFYNADLLDIPQLNNEEYGVAFVDDTAYVAVADTM